MARPKQDVHRTVQRIVRFTTDEAAEVEAAAAADGAGSVARWSRERLLEAARRTRL